MSHKCAAASGTIGAGMSQILGGLGSGFSKVQRSAGYSLFVAASHLRVLDMIRSENRHRKLQPLQYAGCAAASVESSGMGDAGGAGGEI